MIVTKVEDKARDCDGPVVTDMGGYSSTKAFKPRCSAEESTRTFTLEGFSRRNPEHEGTAGSSTEEAGGL